MYRDTLVSVLKKKKKKKREKIRTRFQKISEDVPKYFNYKPVYCNFFDTVFTNTFSYRCLK